MSKQFGPLSADVALLLRDARIGSGEALGQLLAVYRPFLLALANDEFDADLRAKAGPSDVVQETFVEVQRDFEQFTSDSPSQFGVWLQAILKNNLADLRKRYLRTKKRQVRRERPLGSWDSDFLPRDLVDAADGSPSRVAISREEQERISAALDRLRPAFRQIIVLRNQERRSFAEIGKLLDRSPDAARVLWQRAILKLRSELGSTRDER